MWSLIASAASSASGILILLSVVASLIGVGAFEQHKIDANALTSLKAQYAQATAVALAKGAAIQQANDNRAIAAASSEAAVQTQIATDLQKELTDARMHATIVQKISPSCVPWGAYRLLYAGSHGGDPAGLGYFAGKSDDACSPIGWLDLAAAILHDYSQARANGEQLNALEGVLTKQGVKVR